LTPVCEEALRRAEGVTKDVMGRLVVPDTALVGVPGSFAKSAIVHVETIRAEPEKPISRRELQRFLRRLYHTATQQLLQDSRSGDGSISFELIEAQVAEIAVDGHNVTTPLQFTGAKLHATAVTVFGEAPFISALQEVMGRLRLEASSIPVFWTLASAMMTREAIGIVLDVHETTIFWQRGNTVSALETCPYGGQHLVRDLAVSMGLPSFRVKALQDAYVSGQLDEDFREWMETSIQYSVEQWLHALNQMLPHLTKHPNLPGQVCFWQMGPGLPGLADALRGWLKRWPVDRLPTLEEHGSGDIPRVSDRTGLLSDEPSDTALLALAHYAGTVAYRTDPVGDLLRSMLA
jgi:hypothetical protein